MSYSIALDPKPGALRPWLILEQSTDIPDLWVVIGGCERLDEARMMIQSFKLADIEISKVATGPQ